jgi:hypothetical protein
MRKLGSLHNLCGFKHCWNDEDVKAHLVTTYDPSVSTILQHNEVVSQVYRGYNTEGINHYFVGPDYEAHGATSMFYKELWTHGMKFMPGNMGLRCQRAEDSDHNTKLTLLLQKTSVLCEPLYCYRRNTSTNGAYLEGL